MVQASAKENRVPKGTTNEWRGYECDERRTISNAFSLKFPLKSRAIVDPGRGKGGAGE